MTPRRRKADQRDKRKLLGSVLGAVVAAATAIGLGWDDVRAIAGSPERIAVVEAEQRHLAAGLDEVKGMLREMRGEQTRRLDEIWRAVSAR